MGKASIISHLGAGLYRVSLDYDRSRAEAEIARLVDETSEISARLATMTEEISAAALDLQYQEQVLVAAVATLGQATPETRAAAEAAVKTATAAMNTASVTLLNLQQTRIWLQLRQVANEKRGAFLAEHVLITHEVDAWCADYNLELSGAVGTVEVGRVAGGPAVIRPGGETGNLAAHDAAMDGQLQAVLASTPAAVFANYALLPGAAKWRPRFRIGAITALSGDSCNLSLEPHLSTHQQLDTGPGPSLASVPIQYMTCNAAAFTVGDRVIVEFVGQDRSQPVVVGFVTEPRPCFGALDLICDPQSDSAATGRQLLSLRGSDWSAAPSGFVAGNVDWRGHYVGGRPTKVLTFWGPFRRYGYGVFGTSIFANGSLYSSYPSSVVCGVSIVIFDGVEYLAAIVETSTGIGVRLRTNTKLGSPGFYDADTNPHGWRSLGDFVPVGAVLTANGQALSPDGFLVNNIRLLPPWYASGNGRDFRAMYRVGRINGQGVNVGVLAHCRIQITSPTAAVFDEIGVSPAGTASVYTYKESANCEWFSGPGPRGTILDRRSDSTIGSGLVAVDFLDGELIELLLDRDYSLEAADDGRWLGDNAASQEGHVTSRESIGYTVRKNGFQQYKITTRTASLDNAYTYYQDTSGLGSASETDNHVRENRSVLLCDLRSGHFFMEKLTESTLYQANIDASNWTYDKTTVWEVIKNGSIVSSSAPIVDPQQTGSGPGVSPDKFNHLFACWDNHTPPPTTTAYSNDYNVTDWEESQSNEIYLGSGVFSAEGAFASIMRGGRVGHYMVPSGDPLALTGLTGDRPRYYPVRLIGIGGQ